MAHVWNRHHQVMVHYDAEGRPVGETAREMHSFFGVLVRRSDIIPVEPRDWRLMEAAVRDRVWEEIWVSARILIIFLHFTCLYYICLIRIIL